MSQMSQPHFVDAVRHQTCSGKSYRLAKPSEEMVADRGLDMEESWDVGDAVMDDMAYSPLCLFHQAIGLPRHHPHLRVARKWWPTEVQTKRAPMCLRVQFNVPIQFCVTNAWSGCNEKGSFAFKWVILTFLFKLFWAHSRSQVILPAGEHCVPIIAYAIPVQIASCCYTK